MADCDVRRRSAGKPNNTPNHQIIRNEEHQYARVRIAGMEEFRKGQHALPALGVIEAMPRRYRGLIQRHDD